MPAAYTSVKVYRMAVILSLCALMGCSLMKSHPYDYSSQELQDYGNRRRPPGNPMQGSMPGGMYSAPMVPGISMEQIQSGMGGYGASPYGMNAQTMPPSMPQSPMTSSGLPLYPSSPGDVSRNPYSQGYGASSMGSSGSMMAPPVMPSWPSSTSPYGAGSSGSPYGTFTPSLPSNPSENSGAPSSGSYYSPSLKSKKSLSQNDEDYAQMLEDMKRGFMNKRFAAFQGGIILPAQPAADAVGGTTAPEGATGDIPDTFSGGATVPTATVPSGTASATENVQQGFNDVGQGGNYNPFNVTNHTLEAHYDTLAAHYTLPIEEAPIVLAQNDAADTEDSVWEATKKAFFSGTDTVTGKDFPHLDTVPQKPERFTTIRSEQQKEMNSLMGLQQQREHTRDAIQSGEFSAETMREERENPPPATLSEQPALVQRAGQPAPVSLENAEESQVKMPETITENQEAPISTPLSITAPTPTPRTLSEKETRTEHADEQEQLPTTPIANTTQATPAPTPSVPVSPSASAIPVVPDFPTAVKVLPESRYANRRNRLRTQFLQDNADTARTDTLHGFSGRNARLGTQTIH